MEVIDRHPQCTYTRINVYRCGSRYKGQYKYLIIFDRVVKFSIQACIQLTNIGMIFATSMFKKQLFHVYDSKFTKKIRFFNIFNISCKQCLERLEIHCERQQIKYLLLWVSCCFNYTIAPNFIVGEKEAFANNIQLINKTIYKWRPL